MEETAFRVLMYR